MIGRLPQRTKIQISAIASTTNVAIRYLPPAQQARYSRRSALTHHQQPCQRLLPPQSTKPRNHAIPSTIPPTASSATSPITSIRTTSTTPLPAPSPRSTDRAASRPHKPASQPATMPTSDADYTAFLEKASADTDRASSTTTTKPAEKTMTTQHTNSAPVPAVLSSLDAYYTSDTDERFQGVALRLETKAGREVAGEGDRGGLEVMGGRGKGLDTRTFREMVRLDGESEVEMMTVGEWDPRGEYGEIVGRVREAAGRGGEVVVFRVGKGGVRCEYWVLGEGAGDVVCGFMVGAVES